MIAAMITAIIASIDRTWLLSTAKTVGETLQAVAQDAVTRSMGSLGIASDAGVIRRVAEGAMAQAAALVQPCARGTWSEMLLVAGLKAHPVWLFTWAQACR
jgi:hypothetical protein